MRKYLFLYLTLACFFGLIAIFVVDGYFGVYDTLYLPMGEREQKIETDQWLQWSKWERAEVIWGEKAFFSYEVENRQFSIYSANIAVSVWHSKEKMRDLISQEISIPAFDKGQLEWVIDTRELFPSGIPPEQGYEFTIIIERGGIERNIIVYMHPLPTRIVPGA